MGRRSQAVRSRIQNLGQAPKNQKAWPGVDDSITDSDSEDHEAAEVAPDNYGFILFEDYESEDELDDNHLPGLSDLEEPDDSDLEDEDHQEIRNEADLFQFADILAEAQKVAIKLEQEIDKSKPNRPKHYTGNATRTKRFHAQKRRIIGAKGQKFIDQYYPARANIPQPMPAPPEESHEDTSGVPDSGNDEDDFIIDIEEHLDRIFGGPEVIRSGMSTPSESSDSESVSEIESEFYSPEPLEINIPASATRATPELESEGSKINPDPEIRVKTAEERVRELLENMKKKRLPSDTIPDDQTDTLLNSLSYMDFPDLRRAQAKLVVKSKDKLLDVFFRSRITGMVGTLNLYLDPQLSYTWRESSLLTSKAAGHGMNHARNLRMWILRFLNTGKLPLHRYGTFHSSILEDEDIAHAIQLHLLEINKNGYIRAQDIVDYVATPEMQEQLAGKTKTTIHVRTARRWLNKLNWRYSRKKNGMYVDGHERKDVVKYRDEFIARWREYEKRFIKYDNNGNAINQLVGFPVPQVGRFQLILITHDESTFYANDRRKTKWIHASETAVAEAKGEGQSLMASEFCVPQWGPLRDGEETARIIFKAGKNRDGWFSSDDLLTQVDMAIDVFEGRTNGFATGLFLFDNAPSHQKRAPDALSARTMPKNPHATWRQHKDGPTMRTTTFKLGDQMIDQDFYFPDEHPTMPGWFKGMENIIRERQLWPAKGLNAQCEGFKCVPGKTDCCCRRLLFTQPDFIAQKSHLEEFIASRGHICDFYPKYHCELNFIEQYWGAAKFRYRSSPKTTDIVEMEKNVIACLDGVPQLQILRYANRSARFIDAYGQGLSGPEAAWANKKYHGHRTLPPDMIASVKKSYQEYITQLDKLDIASQTVA